MRAILVECDLIDPDGEPLTLRFADRAFPPMPPGDPDRPNAVWDDRLVDPPTLQRRLYDDFQRLEPGLSAGAMTLANADRALDAYQGHIWGEVRVWRWTVGTAFAAARPLMTGLASSTPIYDASTARAGRVQLTLFDHRLELEKAVQTTTYAGLNDGEDVWFEGASALKGRVKPLAFGDLSAAHVPAAAANAQTQTWQLHDGALWLSDGLIPAPSVAMFDRGGAAGVAYAGDIGPYMADDEAFATFDANSPPPEMATGWPAAPRYWTWAARGLVRTEANLAGTVAFGLKGSAEGGYAAAVGPVAARLLARLGVAPGRIGASFDALALDAVVGVYADAETTGRDLVGWLARSGPVAVIPDRHGVWQAVEIAPPLDPPALTLTADDILSAEGDEAAPSGPGVIRVGYDRIWTTYRRDQIQAGMRNTEAEARLAESYRYVELEDAALKARFPATWRTLTVETALREAADAQALAERLAALFGLRPDGRPRRSWRIVVEATDAVLDIELGATVEIAAAQWGLSDRYLLIGEEPLRPRRGLITWTVWG